MTLLTLAARSTMKGARQVLRWSGVPFNAVRSETVLVPICPLDPAHLPALTQHLLSLGAHDRYLRFGYAATDEQIIRYLQGLDFERDEIYGIFNRDLEVIAMAHLAIMKGEGKQPSAEFGVSVCVSARGRGYGGRLFERAVMHARNQKISLIYIHALSENAPMIRIARKSGATLERDGSETEAYLRLPKRTLETRLTEVVSDQFAQVNYNVKEDSKRFWDFLTQVQEIRQGVRKARHQSAE